MGPTAQLHTPYTRISYEGYSDELSFGRSVRLHPVRGKPVSMYIEVFEEGFNLLETRAPRD